MLTKTRNAKGNSSEDSRRSLPARGGKVLQHQIAPPQRALPLLKTETPAGLVGPQRWEESGIQHFAPAASSAMPAETLTGTLAPSVKRKAGYEQEGPRLTNREIDVLAHVASGLSNKQIAGRLSLSEKTVRNHLSNIFGKLEACNRTQAVMTAMRSGLRIWP